jgi:hypothetical protein
MLSKGIKKAMWLSRWHQHKWVFGNRREDVQIGGESLRMHALTPKSGVIPPHLLPPQ